MVASDLFEPVWTALTPGQRVSVVLRDVIWHETAVVGVSIPGGQVVRVSGVVNPEAAGFPRLTVLAGSFVSCTSLADLSLDSQSSILPHRPVLHEDVLNYVELCAGMGTSSFGFSKVGFRPRCAVEWQAALVDLHSRIHPGVPVIHADVCEESTVAKIHQVWPDPSLLMAGVSCQPYSRGGLGHGGDDVRASTFPAALRIMHLLQSPMLVVECVTQAQDNAFIADHVKALETQLGFKITHCRFRLENVWAACRYRWWLVASHPTLGTVSVPPQPSGSTLSVRDLMPFVLRWPAEVENQLMLTDLELEKFQSHGRTMRQYVVQQDQKLPTALHSWGGQIVPCACGCRDSGFSDALLESKGLYAQLVHFTASDGSVVYRHLHAVEVAILCGVPPCLNWSDNERLNLCAIGQMAAPMQSVWVGASIIRHLQKTFTTEDLLDPLHALNDLKQIVVEQSKTFFTVVPMPVSAPPAPESHVLEVLLTDGATFSVRCGPSATVRDLVWAECDLRHLPVFELCACLPDADDVLPLDLALHKFEKICLRECVQDIADSRHDDTQALATDDVDRKPSDPIAPTQVDEDVAMSEPQFTEVPVSDVGCGMSSPRSVDTTVASLFQLRPEQLTEMLPPLIGDPNLLPALTQQMLDSDVRKSLLDLQQHVWGDDEVKWHMHKVVAGAVTHDTLVLDPLLASSWIRMGNVAWVKSWLPADDLGNRIVSAVLWDGHWAPFVWVKKVSHLEVVCWEHEDVDMHHFYPLHGLLCQALELPMFRVACTRRNFGRDMCGAACLAFIRSMLAQGNLPFDDSGLADINLSLKVDFRQFVDLHDEVLKPWCWGSGVQDVRMVLANLLQFHGVPNTVSTQRAKLVLQSLGRDQVQSVLGGVAPWKSLKQLANQHSPVIQLVLPDELAAVTNAKKAKG